MAPPTMMIWAEKRTGSVTTPMATAVPKTMAATAVPKTMAVTAVPKNGNCSANNDGIRKNSGIGRKRAIAVPAMTKMPATKQWQQDQQRCQHKKQYIQ